jgi:CBS domain-containing protein
MDPNFLYASPAESIGALLQEMGQLGLCSIPVLDLQGHPLGVASAQELNQSRRVTELSERLHRPAVCVHESAGIEEAARVAVRENAETVLLVDDQGIAVGALRALDLLRALLNDACSSSPQPEAQQQEVWSPARLLDLESLRQAPSAAGVVLLEQATDEQSPEVVWVEAPLDLRGRLDEMLRLPQADPRLEALLAVYPRRLNFRTLVVADPERRSRFLHCLVRVLDAAPAQAETPPSASRADFH